VLKRLLIGGIFFLLLLLLAGNASSEVEPIYAGWTVGDSWDDGSATGSYGTILRSTDSGKTWIRQGAGQIADVHLWGVFAVDAYIAWAWAVGDSGVILHSSDGGVTWMIHFTPEHEIIHLQGVYAVNPSTVWVAGDNNIYWTHDGGENWDDGGHHGLAACGQPHAPGVFFSITAVSAQKAWGTFAGTTGCVANTIDGGDSWTTINQLDGEYLPSMEDISFATLPIYPDYLIISMIEGVEMLVEDGILNKGQDNAIIVKLKKALDRLDEDR
jgi:photosystem II stability/assembly factor-like uncharacterized protein